MKSLLTGLSLGIVSFVFYSHTAAQLAPRTFNDIDVVFEADTGDLTDYYRLGPQFDVNERDYNNHLRHILFRPTTGWLYGTIRDSFSLDPDTALVALIALLAALNIVAAFLVLLVCHNTLGVALAFSLLYGLSYASVVSLSIPETFLGANLFFLVFLSAFLRLSKGRLYPLGAWLTLTALVGVAASYSLHFLSLIIPGLCYIVLVSCRESWQSLPRLEVSLRRLRGAFVSLGLVAVGASVTFDAWARTNNVGFGPSQLVLLVTGTVMVLGGVLGTRATLPASSLLVRIRRAFVHGIGMMVNVVRSLGTKRRIIGIYLSTGALCAGFVVAVPYVFLAGVGTAIEANTGVMARWSSFTNLLNITHVVSVVIRYLLYAVVSPVTAVKNAHELGDVVGYASVLRLPIVVAYVWWLVRAVVYLARHRSDRIEALMVWATCFAVFTVFFTPRAAMLWSGHLLMVIVLLLSYAFVANESRYRYLLLGVWIAALGANNVLTLSG